MIGGGYLRRLQLPRFFSVRASHLRAVSSWTATATIISITIVSQLLIFAEYRNDRSVFQRNIYELGASIERLSLATELSVENELWESCRERGKATEACDEAVLAADALLDAIVHLQSTSGLTHAAADFGAVQRAVAAFQQNLSSIEIDASGVGRAEDRDQRAFSANTEEVRGALGTLETSVANQAHAATLSSQSNYLWQQAILLLLSLAAVTLIVWRVQDRRRLQAIEVSAKSLEASNVRLLDANEALKQFASLVSHDLKSPARHMRMFAHLIQENPNDPETVKDCANNIADASERMTALIDSLLEFSKTGYKQPQLQTVNAEKLVRGVVAELLPEGEGARGRINIEPLPIIIADPELLHRCFSNLIENALKYHHPGEPAQVTIRGHSCSDVDRFIIEDRGIGIDPDYADAIFEPRRRLHGENSIYPGMGLGLSMVKAIATAHRGHVWLDTSYTDGARFVLELPRRKP